MENLAPLAPNDKKPKKRASKKQIQANLINGKLGGPKTELGKMRVSQNAIKHALLAQEVVIEFGDGAENQHDFDLLFREYIEHCAPQGPIENTLVELMAVSYWRYRRLIKAEKGEIRRHLDSVHMRNRNDQIAEHESFKTMLYEPKNPELICNVLELNDVLKFIKEASEDLESLCFISEPKIMKMSNYFGREHDSIATLLLFHNIAFKEEALEYLENDKDPNESPEIKMAIGSLLVKLGQEKERVISHSKRIKEQEDMNISSQTLCLNVPPKEIMDKFIRYESSILRQFFKAMHELERIQRRRKGEFVPSPINVDLAVDKN